MTTIISNPAAATSSAWHQDRHWLVLDVTDGMDHARVVEGPVSCAVALRRELELRAVAKSRKQAV